MLGLLAQQLPQASTFAVKSDLLYSYIFWFSVISFTGVMAAMFYFIYRYSRKKSNPDTTPHIDGNVAFESAVSITLFVVVMVIFGWGWKDYHFVRSFPQDSLEINVTGKQWAWDMEYTNGRTLGNELVVPVDTPVTLILASRDVLHSFYVPSFRIKQDAVPGRFTKLWFKATEIGEYPAYCAEFCGTAHSGMIALVRVVSKEDYETWQKTWELQKRLGITETPSATALKIPSENTDGENAALRGQKAFMNKGCAACHASNEKAGVGPGLAKLFGKEVELIDGRKVKVDENYIRTSLMEPNEHVVKGFSPLMPTFKGQLSDDEIMSLVAYIKSLQ